MRLIDADALIKKCGEWYTEEGPEEGYIGPLKHLLNKQPTIEPKQGWIPCSEGLPELGENVLVTCLMFDDYRDIGIYTRQWTSDHSEIRWFSDDEYGQLFDCDVVAWMPLPEPWEGADDDNA